MNRKKYILLSVCAFFIAANALLLFMPTGVVLNKGFFASGLVLFSDGSSDPVSIRIHAGNGLIHDFEKSGSQSSHFKLKILSSLFARYSLVTVHSNQVGGRYKEPLDRDLAFNFSYYSKEKSSVHLHELNIPSEARCFYVREFEKLRCYGIDRVRRLPPF